MFDFRSSASFANKNLTMLYTTLIVSLIQLKQYIETEFIRNLEVDYVFDQSDIYTQIEFWHRASGHFVLIFYS